MIDAKARLAIPVTSQGGVDSLASPDGRWLIWSQLDQVGSDIMLMENFR